MYAFSRGPGQMLLRRMVVPSLAALPLMIDGAPASAQGVDSVTRTPDVDSAMFIQTGNVAGHFWDWGPYDWMDLAAGGAASWLGGAVLKSILGDPGTQKVLDALDRAIREIERFIAHQFLQENVRRISVDLADVLIYLNNSSDPKIPATNASLAELEKAKQQAQHAVVDAQSLGFAGLIPYSLAVSYYNISCAMLYKKSRNISEALFHRQSAANIVLSASDYLND